MPATINGGGDQLARGAVRATFRSPDVSIEKWKDIFGEDSGPKPNYIVGSDDAVEPVKVSKTTRKKK